MVTKAEVYKSLIEIQKSSGQGLSGIVRVLGNDSSKFGEYLDELIEEGLVECYDGCGSLGHPESNRWYMPTSGYNVWRDGLENGSSDTSFLTHVRLYLGQLDDAENEEDSKIAKWLNPSAQMLFQNVDFMSVYAEWIKRNKDQLDVMTNLSEIYVGEGIIFSDEENDIIISKDWYKENKKIKDCLSESKEFLSNKKQFISLTNQLISLYKQKGNSDDEIQKSKHEISEAEGAIAFRKKLHSWLETQDMNSNIQDVFGKEKETI